MDVESGEIEYLYNWGTKELYSHDVCKVITFDDYHNEIVMIGETTNESLRPDLKTLYPDSTL